MMEMKDFGGQLQPHYIQVVLGPTKVQLGLRLGEP